MSKFPFRAGTLALTLVVLAGCFSSDPAPDDRMSDRSTAGDATPGQLVATIIAMSKTPDLYNETPDRHAYTRQLASMGPTALAPILDYMAAPDTPDTARLFILQCVNELLTPVYLPNLIPMLKSENQVTRAVGVTAIAEVDDPSVAPLLETARNDPTPRVAFSALSGQALQGSADARDQLRTMYLTDSTMGDISVEQIKREVVRVLVRDAQPEDLPILTDALNKPFVEVNFRAAIVRALGRLGDPSVIPLLQESVGLQNEDAYGKLVQQAIEAIQERESQA